MWGLIKVVPMEAKARGEFLKKISVNGFSIEEKGKQLILRPRGALATAEITIEEVKSDTWIVMSAAGRYAAYGRGRKRLIFENYIKQWVTESILRATGESFPLPSAPE